MQYRDRIVVLGLILLLVSPPKAMCSERKAGFVPSINLTSPQILSATIGYVILLDAPKQAGSWTKGILFQFEPGIGGAKAHVGYYRGNDSAEWFGFAWVAKLSALYTYGNPIGVDPNRTYIGGEVTGVLISDLPPLRLTLGIFHDLSGAEDHEWLLSGGIGIGF